MGQVIHWSLALSHRIWTSKEWRAHISVPSHDLSSQTRLTRSGYTTWSLYLRPAPNSLIPSRVKFRPPYLSVGHQMVTIHTPYSAWSLITHLLQILEAPAHHAINIIPYFSVTCQSFRLFIIAQKFEMLLWGNNFAFCHIVDVWQ